MVRCIDAKTLTKSLPEFIRTSMLTFFNNAAVDLERCIQFLQEVSQLLLITMFFNYYYKGTLEMSITITEVH